MADNVTQVTLKRSKPFQTKQYKGKGGKAESTRLSKLKYEGLKGGVWDEEEENMMQLLLEEGLTDVSALAEKFSRSVRVVRRKLKKIAIAVGEIRGAEEAATFTGLDVSAVRKLLSNKEKREKKKAAKLNNKTLPPQDEVVELLKTISANVILINAQIARLMQARPQCDYPPTWQASGHLVLDAVDVTECAAE